MANTGVNFWNRLGEKWRGDKITGFWYPKIKLAYGADGSATDVTSGNPLPVTGSLSVQGGATLDSTNSTSTPLSASATYTGTAVDVLAYNQIHVVLKMSPNVVPDGDANTAAGSFYAEFSPDATNWDISIPVHVRSGIFIPQTYIVVDRYFRIRYINDGGASAITDLATGETADTARNQTAFRLNTYLIGTGTKELGRTIDQSISGSDPVQVTRSVLTGKVAGTADTYKNTEVNPTGHLIPANFLTEVAKGNVSGHELVRISGRNPDIDTAATETLWANGGTFVFPTAAQTIDVTFADANDTAAGTGAQAVVLRGGDVNGDEISETLASNGGTATSVNSYLWLNDMENGAVGSGGTNAGTITAAQTTSGITLASYGAGVGKSQLGVRTIPNNKTGYMLGVTVGAMKGASSGCDVNLRTRKPGEGWVTSGTFGCHTQSGDAYTPFDAPLVLPERTQVLFRGTVTANNTQVKVEAPILLVADGS